jgi:hypothetical protein
MDIVKILRENNINIHILENNICNEPLFRAGDLGLVLEMSNINKNISNFDETEKVTCIIKSNGGPQSTTFLTVKGIKKIISSSRKPSAINLAKLLNINIFDVFYIPLETSLICFLKEVYSAEELVHQYKYNIEPYRIDLYFPKYRLAVECDEYFHDNKKEEDIKRENYIKEKLDCKFLRFKQDKKNKYLPILLNDINKNIESVKLDEISQLKLENEKLKSVIDKIQLAILSI